MKIKFIMFFIVVNLVIAANLFAETATVSGQIKNNKGNPIDKITVSIGNKSDFTDVDGKYRIKDVPTGKQKMRIKKGQKVLKEVEIEVDKHSITKDESLR